MPGAKLVSARLGEGDCTAEIVRILIILRIPIILRILIIIRVWIIIRVPIILIIRIILCVSAVTRFLFAALAAVIDVVLPFRFLQHSAHAVSIDVVHVDIKMPAAIS